MLREATRPGRSGVPTAPYADLTRGNPILQVLSHYCGIDRQRIDLEGGGFEVDGVTGVQWRATTGSEQTGSLFTQSRSTGGRDNVALLITDEGDGRTALYAPGLGAIEERVWNAMQTADCVLVDGTFWTDEEMIGLGLSRKRARDIGHLPQSGPGGMLEWLEKLPPSTRKILIHIKTPSHTR